MNSEKVYTHEDYMRRAIELAKKGAGWTSPNPLVGAVIVKDGEIIGEGYHEKYGDLHAERNALKHCIKDPKDAVMYVTLEPCCHHGKQPPCTEAVIASGIKKVYVGSDDPNPLVAGKGIELLREKGIEVITQFLKEECDKINDIFFHYIQTKTPYVMMKYAMTMDGKIAAFTGDSKWITGDLAREKVHKDRHHYTAIMAGIGTVLADDPMLNCRLENMQTKNPTRIICDSTLKIPVDCQIVKTAKEIETWIVCCNASLQKKQQLEDSGCKIIEVPEKNGHIDLNAMMMILGEKGIDSILLEGGGTLNWAALESGVVHKVQTYIAPKIIGGKDAKTPIEGYGFEKMAQAIKLKNSQIYQFGNDYMIESEVE